MSKVVLKSKKIKINTNPTLDTIKMVEQTLSKMSEYPTKNKLWRALPRQVQYPTFKTVLNYLEESNKIIYDKDGTIIWIFVDNPKLKRLVKTSKPLL
ncbi:MAG: hypothetical protein Q8Q69_04380 [Nitrosopumilaceae archaeon]|jgi:hypothetical protein|nr:hypothetical protein [Nitrosopumilaceae archaeon]